MHILLVRLRLIGDVVFTTPLIGALRRRFPKARLTYLVESPAAPVVRHHPDLDDVWVVERRRGLQRLADDLGLARRLHGAKVDVAIDLHGGPRSAWMTWVTRAPQRIGYDIRGRSWAYTNVVPRAVTWQGGHAVENQWALLAAVGTEFSAPADRTRNRVTMTADVAARDAVDRDLRQRGVPDDAALVVLHVSAGNPFRRWPESSFAELAADLVMSAPNRWVLVTGGPSDREATMRVLSAARSRAGTAADRLIDVERWSLDELRASLDRAALFIGGDSGPLHIAATSDVPIVGLYGPTLPARSAPWRPPHLATASVDVGELPCRPCEQRVCVPGDFRCLTGLPASAVREAALGLLSAR